ncbi:MAG: transcriptional repressor LexA [Clostridia bacterium]|nr:transcriptional repressor LexA [Clostridia bacterium]
MELENLNSTQKKIYEYLLERSRKTAVPASVREIGAAVGLKSTSSVQANLNALEEAGYITRDPLLKRSIRLNVQDEAKHFLEVPLVGTVAAGAPILAAEQIESYIPFGGPLSSDKTLFALRVKGESMINAGILEGDVIIVEQTNVAKNGEMVVALIDDEATVKTFYKEADHFRLQPENDYMDPIICDELIILGKVVGLMRYY